MFKLSLLICGSSHSIRSHRAERFYRMSAQIHQRSNRYKTPELTQKGLPYGSVYIYTCQIRRKSFRIMVSALGLECGTLFNL